MFTHYSQDMESVKVSTDRGVNKENVAYIQIIKYHSFMKKKSSPVICDIMDRTAGHHVVK